MKSLYNMLRTPFVIAFLTLLFSFFSFSFSFFLGWPFYLSFWVHLIFFSFLFFKEVEWLSDGDGDNQCVVLPFSLLHCAIALVTLGCIALHYINYDGEEFVISSIYLKTLFLRNLALVTRTGIA